MTATNHALTGAIIGLAVSNPLVALPAAFFSHFVCDMVPHFGMENKNWIKSRGFRNYLLMDMLLCLCLVAVLFVGRNPHWLIASICAFLATSPDFLWIRRFSRAARGAKRSLSALETLLIRIQWLEKPIGAVVEVAWCAAAVVILWQFF